MNGIIERFVKDAPQPHAHVHAPDRTIGTLLLEDGKLKAGDAERALRLAKDTGIRFGEACVQLKIVSPQDVWVLDPTPTPSLTLVTCYPFFAIQPGGPLRYVVVAGRVDG